MDKATMASEWIDFVGKDVASKMRRPYKWPR